MPMPSFRSLVTTKTQIGASTTVVTPLSVRDAWAVAVLTAAGLAVAMASIASRPGVILGPQFLFDDEGQNLLIVHTILSGGALYRDVYSQYGPIPAYVHALVASVFGNTPLVYLSFLAVVSSANVGLAYALVRRAANLPVAVFVTAVGVLPVVLIPGALAGGYTSTAYMPLERMLLLLVALSWAAPTQRSVRRSILVGCLLGAWQGLRFGAVAAAGGSILVIDVLYLWSIGFTRAHLRAWAASLFPMAAAFIGIELLWAIYAFATLPAALALDVLWPLYILESYEVWSTAAGRWLWWGGWRLTIGQYLLPLSAGLLGLSALRRWSAGARRSEAPGPGQSAWADCGAVFIPLCFYLIGCFFLFRMVHHYRQFLWALVPAAAWELQRRGAAVRTAVACIWAPGFALMIRASVVPAAAASLLVTVNLPTGGTIRTSAPLAERLRFLERFTTQDARGAPVLFVQRGLGGASGWHYAYTVPHATRHTWFFASNVIRPYEEAAFIEALSRTVALIECDESDGGDQHPGGALDLPFPPAVAQAVRSRLTPWKSEAGCRVYHLR
jgi:hypothetical protein